MSHTRYGAFVALTLLVLTASDATALEPSQVLVVANAAVPGSADLAAYYARRRAIPSDQVLTLTAPTTELVERQTFERVIEAPIAAWLLERNRVDGILAIVLCKGVPHRVAGTVGRAGTQASVDSELTLLYRRMVGQPVPPQGPTANPYFLGSRPLAEAAAFARSDYDTYLVTRLDGFTFEDARALVDRAASATQPDGVFVLDQREGHDLGDEWLVEAASRLRRHLPASAAIIDVRPTLPSEARLMGVYSWGSSDPALRSRRSTWRFAPGAIAGRFMSTDARTFVEPPGDWQMGPWDAPGRFFEGSPEALAGDVIRDGVTAVSANVAEPYLDSAIRPEILLPAYASGFTVAEAFYLAMPSLGWQTLVLGDPLAAPFAVLRAGGETDPVGQAPMLDAVTGFPSVFSERRVELMRAASVVSRQAARLAVRAERLSLTGDAAGAVAALEEATAEEPDFLLAQSMLAGAYERQGAYERAQECYRAILRLRPRDLMALNNLAFSLAERSNRAAEALPLAQQAYATAGGNPLVADTLGWVEFKLGNFNKAASYLQEAVVGAPARADLRLRLGTVFAAQRRWTDAERELERATEIDPAIGETDGARQLRSLIRRQDPSVRP